jgi:hypothetical protein
LIDWAAAALLLLTMEVPAASDDGGPALQLAQLTVRERIIVRIPVPMAPQKPLIEWKPTKGPKCIPAKMIAAAALSSESSVDFLLRDNRRVRAELDNDCPALDYYRGFYISPNADGQVCADRDIIRSRMGGACGIGRFRNLKPVPRD